jgi:hypothetical protein
LIFQLPLDNNTGFTPVKLPTDLDNGSEAGLSDIPTGFTPIKLNILFLAVAAILKSIFA